MGAVVRGADPPDTSPIFLPGPARCVFADRIETPACVILRVDRSREGVFVLGARARRRSPSFSCARSRTCARHQPRWCVPVAAIANFARRVASRAGLSGVGRATAVATVCPARVLCQSTPADDGERPRPRPRPRDGRDAGAETRDGLPGHVRRRCRAPGAMPAGSTRRTRPLERFLASKTARIWMRGVGRGRRDANASSRVRVRCWSVLRARARAYCPAPRPRIPASSSSRAGADHRSLHPFRIFSSPPGEPHEGASHSQARAEHLRRRVR